MRKPERDRGKISFFYKGEDVTDCDDLYAPGYESRRIRRKIREQEERDKQAEELDKL